MDVKYFDSVDWVMWKSVEEVWWWDVGGMVVMRSEGCVMGEGMMEDSVRELDE